MSQLEALLTEIPGPRSRELRATLGAHEPRGVTYLGDDFPVFWESSEGATVTDVDGNRFLDLTSAFGVANTGHTNPYVAAAVADQAVRLIHGMGDVHPSETKAHLLATLATVLPGDCTMVYLCTTGSEAVEFALKTAVLKTGRSRFVAYHNAYHGLSFGALGVGGIERFRKPWNALVSDHTTFLAYPGTETKLDKALAAAREALTGNDVAALVVEPVQGRGGVIVPPKGYLAGLRKICDETGTALVVDEIYTGFGRTGRFFATEIEDVVPDALCVGKAIAGGVPLAATAGRRAFMDAWPASDGEALHTSTYQGNPLACAAALANLGEMKRIDVAARAQDLGKHLNNMLGRMVRYESVTAIRGVGALWGVELNSAEMATKIVRRALARGVILLQSGAEGNGLTFAPPLVMETDQLLRALMLVEASMTDVKA